MKNPISSATDARQKPQWGKYLQFLGWETKRVGLIQMFIRKMPLTNRTFIKVQHSKGPYPFEKIDAVAQQHKAFWTIIEPHTQNFDEAQFKLHGFQPSKLMFAHTSTIKIDLTQNEKKLWKSFSENARRNIKKAQQNNLEVRVITMKEKQNWSYFDTFYDLLSNLSKMKHFYIPSKEEYFHKMQAFKDTSLLVFAYADNQPIAVVWFAYFDDVIAYFQTGITERGYATLANYLLVWEGLKLAQKMKLKVFDFESIFDSRFPKHLPEKLKYTDFKKRFHGEIILYPPPMIKTYGLIATLFYRLLTIL